MGGDSLFLMIAAAVFLAYACAQAAGLLAIRGRTGTARAVVERWEWEQRRPAGSRGYRNVKRAYVRYEIGGKIYRPAGKIRIRTDEGIGSMKTVRYLKASPGTLVFWSPGRMAGALALSGACILLSCVKL